MQRTNYSLVKNTSFLLCVTAIIFFTSKFWLPVLQDFNPITTPHQSWTELHHLVALLIGMITFIGVSTFGFSVFKILRKVDKKLAEQEKKYAKTLSSRRKVIQLCTIICALVTITMSLGSVVIFGYQILNHPTFGVVVQVSLVLGSGLIASAFAIFVISFWLPNKVYSLVCASLSTLNYKLLDALIQELKQSLQNINTQSQALVDNEQALRRQYIQLKHEINDFQAKIQHESDEDARDKLAYEYQVRLDRFDECKNKINELMDLQFDKQDEVNQVKSKIAFAKMQKQIIEEQEAIDDLVAYLELKHDDGQGSIVDSTYRNNLESYERLKAKIEGCITKFEGVIKNKGESNTTNIRNAFIEIQKASGVALVLKDFILQEKQQAKSYAKEILEYIAVLKGDDQQMRKEKAKKKYHLYLEMATNYQNLAQGLNPAIEFLKDSNGTLKHRLSLATANQTIKKSKKSST